MLDPFDAWNRLVAVQGSMARTGLRMAQTMSAANEVVIARTALASSALHSPVRGDHSELARMVPEKVAAFSSAGSAGVSAWWAAQSAWGSEIQHLSALAMRGRPLTAMELSELGERMFSYGLKSIEAAARLGAATVAPVHQKATSNARRLGRKTSQPNRNR
ncbi:MAG: hypothetical protein P0Y56_15400 [Candidatus Andeanibacterium colombiense]|uniref:Phasin domain-containing protein n=1 Tax=Candidatus Andeanibacterium colombiense TaxID=3121345 RepID=A0AAJ5X4M8_9SPHN|nr:MAG: hypothetical protein P0Y56_15400 [Sphingomonadaceae bacterium]